MQIETLERMATNMMLAVCTEKQLMAPVVFGMQFPLQIYKWNCMANKKFVDKAFLKYICRKASLAAYRTPNAAFSIRVFIFGEKITTGLK